MAADAASEAFDACVSCGFDLVSSVLSLSDLPACCVLSLDEDDGVDDGLCDDPDDDEACVLSLLCEALALFDAFALFALLSCGGVLDELEERCGGVGAGGAAAVAFAALLCAAMLCWSVCAKSAALFALALFDEPEP